MVHCRLGHHFVLYFGFLNVSWCPNHTILNRISMRPSDSKCNPLKNKWDKLPIDLLEVCFQIGNYYYMFICPKFTVDCLRYPWCTLK